MPGEIPRPFLAQVGESTGRQSPSRGRKPAAVEVALIEEQVGIVDSVEEAEVLVGNGQTSSGRTVEIRSPHRNVLYKVREGSESEPMPVREEGLEFGRAAIRIVRADEKITPWTRKQDDDKELFRGVPRRYPHIVGASIPRLDRDVNAVTKRHGDIKNPAAYAEALGDRLEEFTDITGEVVIVPDETVLDRRGTPFNIGRALEVTTRALDFAGVTPEDRKRLLKVRRSLELINREALKAEVEKGNIVFPKGVVNLDDVIEVRPGKRKKPTLKRLHRRSATTA